MKDISPEEFLSSPLFYNGKIQNAQEFAKTFNEYIKEHNELPNVGMPINICDLLIESKLLNTKSEVRRFVQAGAVRLDMQKVIDFRTLIIPYNNLIVKVGKRNYIKIKVK